MQRHTLRPLVMVFLAAAFLGLIHQSKSFAEPAQPGDLDGDEIAWFYNHPQITMPQFYQDQAFCAGVADPATAPSEPGTYGSGLVTDFFHAALTPGWSNAIVDRCMLVRGYRRFEVRPGKQRLFWQQLSNAGEGELQSYVSSASPPAGALSAEWRNEFMDRDTSVYAQQVLDVVTPPPNLRREDILYLNNPRYMKNHAVPEFAAGDRIDSNLATVVMAITTPPGHHIGWNQDVVAFVKVDPAGALVQNNNRRPIIVELGQWNHEREPERFQVFQVPAGRFALWRLLGQDVRTTDFCLRTFAFDVAPGDVVYAGRYRLTQEGAISLTADDLEAARNSLGQISPALASALHVASYKNGVRLPCGGYMPGYFAQYGIDLPLGH